MAPSTSKLLFRLYLAEKEKRKNKSRNNYKAAEKLAIVNDFVFMSRSAVPVATVTQASIVRLSGNCVVRLFVRHTSPMRTSVSVYHRHRFPAEIISHCVWLYFRFALSFRDVEEMLAMRGVSLSYETVREWLSIPKIRSHI